MVPVGITVPSSPHVRLGWVKGLRHLHLVAGAVTRLGDPCIINRQGRLSGLDLCWIYVGFMLGLCWIYVGFMLDLCWIYVGFMLGLCWIYVGFMLGLCWVYVGFIMLFYHIFDGLPSSDKMNQ